MRKSSSLFLIALFLLLAPVTASAQQATVSPVSGTVEVQGSPSAGFSALTEAASLPADAVVRTGSDGFALIRYADGTEVVVRPGSRVEVGGEGNQGVRVFLGKVLLRVKRLLTPGQERTYTTPTTVAAVRGTEFGFVVDESGRTDLYVFEGRVAVTHALLGGDEVDVDAGRMTELAPDKPATAPRPFEPGAFDRAGTGEIERGEDRVVEGGQAPVAVRWLAFSDPDLDALENPAYLSTGREGVSAVALGEAGGSSASLDKNGKDLDAVGKDQVLRGLAQGLGRFSLAPGLRVAAFAQGDRGYDRAENITRAPGEALNVFSRDRTDWRIAEGRVLSALDRGGASYGLGIGYRKADHDFETAPSSSPADIFRSEERSDITTLSAGVRFGGDRAFGLAFHHSWINATTVSDADSAALTQNHAALEALWRGERGGATWGAWLRGERTDGSEDVDDPAGALIYHEELNIKTVRMGVGLGLQPAERVVVGVDAAWAAAWEKALQVYASGVTREDEKDLRLSASLHLGTQVAVSGPWHVELSVLHAFEHINRDFAVHPDGGAVGDARGLYDTRSSAAVLYQAEGWVARYAVSSPLSAGRSWVHSIILARSAR